MVGLDNSGFSKTGLNYIRVNRTLYEVIYFANLLCFFLKYADELFADDLTLALRIGYTCQLVVETLLCIDTDEVQLVRTVRTKYCLYLVTLVFTKQTVIDEYAGQLVADRFRHQDACYGRVYTAGQSQKGTTISYFFTDFFDGFLYERIHLPVTCTMADTVYEVMQHLGAFLCMKYLRMCLNAVPAFFFIFHTCNRADRSMGCHTETFRHLGNIVGMAHPAYGLRGYTLIQLRCCVYLYLSLSVFTDRCCGNLAA